MSLRLHHAARILRAASYGRSAWDIQLPTPVGPTAVFSTPTLDFPPQQVGTTSAAQTVTLTNNSSTALSISNIAASSGFAETNTCGTSLAAGANCTISVTFAPTTFGPLTGSVTVTDNAASGSPQTVNLKGKGFSGAVSLSPTSLSFGNQLVGTTSTAKTVTLANSSSAALYITGFASANDFSVAIGNCPLSPNTLAAGAACQFSVTFSPRAMGQFAEQIWVTDSATDSPQAIAVTGAGIAPVLTFSPESLDFGYQKVGTAATLSTALENTGTAGLEITNISSVLGAPFTESNDCPLSPLTIPPGGSCTATFRFAPTTWGQYGASPGLEVTDNAISGTAMGFVGGKAYSGAVTLSSTNVNFGTVQIAQTATQTVTLTNSGDLPLYILGNSNNNDFNFYGDGNGSLTQTNNCPFSPLTLPAGANCTITFSFTPAWVGGMAMDMDIADSAVGFRQTISLTGSGSTPDFSLSVVGSGSASITPGGTASYQVAVAPSGGFNQTVTFACTGAPSRSTCAVSPSSVTLDGTNAQNVKVTVTTTAPSLVPPGPTGTPLLPGGSAINYWWIALLMMAGMLALAFNQRRRRVSLLAGAVLLAALAVSCGGGGGGGGGTVTNPGTPKGTYTLAVTGTSGSLQHQTTLQLTVQ